MPEKYNPKEIEGKWQQKWEEEKLNVARDDSKKEKYYCLDMFPYPSAAGLHVGHPEGYTATDILSRYKRMKGYEVMHPMGWDSFGLPAENYAIKTGIHPKETTEKSIKTFRRQIKSLGFSYDWTREISTSDPEYYKWTQWIFLQLYKNGLAYKKKAAVNWCENDKTVLANEQVVDGKCERCRGEVVQKDLEQWFFKTTDYAEKLLEGLDKIDWPEPIKLMQKEWIGKSEGAEINFPIDKKYNFVFLHGYRGSVETNFFPWLKKELEKHGHEVWAENLPGGEEPKIEEQIEYLKKNAKFNNNTIVITHSLGGPLLMKYLEETDDRIYKAVMLAPPSKLEFLDDNPRPALEKYCDWKFDFKKARRQVESIKIISDIKDPIVPKGHPSEFAEKLNADLVEIDSGDHFNTDKVGGLMEEVVPSIKVFTTRPDTLFGCTYMVLAPESVLVNSLKNEIENWDEVENYINKTKSKSDLERTDMAKEKTGVELKGVKAINPANNEEISVWIADYVLSTYGTGAIMAVPAHDERDFEFAKKFGLEIKEVVVKKIGERNSKAERRDGVAGVIIKNNKVIVLYNKKTNEYRIVGGGYEDSENDFETLKREIIEESGFVDFEIQNYLGQIETNFFAKGKNVERHKFYKGYLVKLLSDKAVEQKFESDEDFDVYWMEKDEAVKKLEAAGAGEEEFVKRAFDERLLCFSGKGNMVNSIEFDGMNSEEAKKKITEKVEGKITVNYKLRDWLISRQRYWGAPIPIIYCDKCGEVPVPEDQLPVKLPDDVDFKPTGESPLKDSELFSKVSCPKCGSDHGVRREVDTMDTFVCSSWYYLRYCDPKNSEKFADNEKLKKWMPVDMYVGGAEHACMHLIYARFFYKALKDLSFIKIDSKKDNDEPFARLKNQGMILGEDHQKMSKSRGNVINPDDVVSEYGADTLRLYEMFMGDFEEVTPWNTESIKGVRRFLDKVWNLIEDKELIDCNGKCEGVSENLPRILNNTIKKVSEDIDKFRFNTAISQMMIFINEVLKSDKLPKDAMEKFLILLSPFAPYITEELWNKLDHEKSIFLEKWPSYNPELIKEEEVDLIIQINGKVRDKVKVKAGISEEEALKIAKESDKIVKYLGSKEIVKVIMIKGRLLNLVVK